MSSPSSPSPLEAAVREVESHAARAGWDRPALVFALVETAELVAREPQLAALLGLDEGADDLPVGHLTPVEQEAVEGNLQDLLPAIVWPPEVAGCAVVLEATTLPEQPDGVEVSEADAEQAASAPDREEARIVAGVVRDGSSFCAIRQRSHDEDDLVLTGADLVPGLLQLLHATLDDPGDDAGDDPGHDPGDEPDDEAGGPW